MSVYITLSKAIKQFKSKKKTTLWVISYNHQALWAKLFAFKVPTLKF